VLRCYAGCNTTGHVALMGTIITRRSKSGASRYTAQIRLKSDGKVVHTESETFGTAALAREWLRRREAELDGQRARGETFGSRMTVGQMITWYEGKEDAGDPWSRTKRADLKKLRLGEMADKRADRLTPADFIAYIRARREGGAGPSTAGNDLVWLGQVFKAVRIELRVNSMRPFVPMNFVLSEPGLNVIFTPSAMCSVMSQS